MSSFILLSWDSLSVPTSIREKLEFHRKAIEKLLEKARAESAPTSTPAPPEVVNQTERTNVYVESPLVRDLARIDALASRPVQEESLMPKNGEKGLLVSNGKKIGAHHTWMKEKNYTSSQYPPIQFSVEEITSGKMKGTFRFRDTNDTTLNRKKEKITFFLDKSRGKEGENGIHPVKIYPLSTIYEAKKDGVKSPNPAQHWKLSEVQSGFLMSAVCSPDLYISFTEKGDVICVPKEKAHVFTWVKQD